MTSIAVDEAVLAYAAIWTETDAVRARELVERSLTPDVEILGPGYRFTGHAAILAEAQRFLRERPGTRVVLASGIDGHHGTARFAIAMLRPDGTPLHTGEDIVFFAADGRIFKVLTYWGALPPLPASCAPQVMLGQDAPPTRAARREP